MFQHFLLVVVQISMEITRIIQDTTKYGLIALILAKYLVGSDSILVSFGAVTLKTLG